MRSNESYGPSRDQHARSTPSFPTHGGRRAGTCPRKPEKLGILHASVQQFHVRWKVLSLLFQTGSHFALACSWICVAATVVLSSAQILPMPFTYYSNLPEFQAECPFAPSPLAVGLLTSILASAAEYSFRLYTLCMSSQP